jgi:hypothetical protein
MQDICQRGGRSFIASIYPNITGLNLFSISKLFYTSTCSKKMTSATMGCELWVFMR